MNDTLAGIYEKLERADECIGNLNREIRLFLDESKYPVVPDENTEAFAEAINYHFSRPVPLRFSILAGEIVHHFRSCLDHLMWELSSFEIRLARPNRIEFPILSSAPDKYESARYDRKVEGLSEGAKAFVLEWQPYTRPNPRNHPLFIINEMDRFDKHRELVVVVTGFARRITPEALRSLSGYGQAKVCIPFDGFEIPMDMDSYVSPEVAFDEVGEWKLKPVIPSFQYLLGVMQGLIGDASEFFK